MNQYQSGDYSKENQLRLVLVGKTGSGKSATGNTILRAKRFKAELSMSSVTSKCQKECGEVQGRSLTLIDTPGFFDTNHYPEVVEMEVLRCLAMCSPGPHAVLLIIPIARFTEEQQQTVDMIEKVFEENVTKHTIIIFTRADELEGKPIEQFISEQTQRIKNVINRFGGRFLAFNNKNPEDTDQVRRLLQKLDEMLAKNKYRHFTNQGTQMMEKALEIMEKKKEEIINQVINKAKQEVRQSGDRRRAAIDQVLNSEMREMERRKRRIQDNIYQLESKIWWEYKTRYPDHVRLHRLKKYLRWEYDNLTNLKMKQAMRIKQSIEDKIALKLQISEEEQRREREERAKSSNGKEWYKSYINIIKYILTFLGGVGTTTILGTCGLFTPAAPAGLAAELSAYIGPELSTILLAAAKQAVHLLPTKFNSVTKMCSIQ